MVSYLDPTTRTVPDQNCLNCPLGMGLDKGGLIRRRSLRAERECPTLSFEEKTDDGTRLILATRPFVSRFMPAMRPSRFSSRRISRRSPRRVGASPFSTFPATCLARPRPQRRDGPRTSVLHPPRRDERFP